LPAFLQRRLYETITASVEHGLLTNLYVVVNQDARHSQFA
jgi:hypothetical protein